MFKRGLRITVDVALHFVISGMFWYAAMGGVL